MNFTLSFNQKTYDLSKEFWQRNEFLKLSQATNDEILKEKYLSLAKFYELDKLHELALMENDLRS